MSTSDEKDPYELLREAVRTARLNAGRASGDHRDFVRLVMRYTSTVGALLGVGLLLLPVEPELDQGAWLVSAAFQALGDGGADTLAGLAFLVMVISLATSPAACPPMPSATTQRPSFASLQIASSLLSRNNPTSVAWL